MYIHVCNRLWHGGSRLCMVVRTSSRACLAGLASSGSYRNWMYLAVSWRYCLSLSHTVSLSSDSGSLTTGIYTRTIFLHSLHYTYVVVCTLIIFHYMCGRLQTLPVHVGNLQQLKELHVRNNRLKYLPASIEQIQLYTFTGMIWSCAHTCLIVC